MFSRVTRTNRHLSKRQSTHTTTPLHFVHQASIVAHKTGFDNPLNWSLIQRRQPNHLDFIIPKAKAQFDIIILILIHKFLFIAIRSR